MTIEQTYLMNVRQVFRSQKKLADAAIASLNTQELNFKLDSDSNSIALLMKHMSGNMLSRWTHFLTTDGEKPDRNRDSEFEDEQLNKEQLCALWEKGWTLFFETLDSLTPEDLLKTITIRGEKHLAIEAINRQVSHYAYHVGQIVLLAKHLKGNSWKSLSIPKGKSNEFNQDYFSKNTK